MSRYNSRDNSPYNSPEDPRYLSTFAAGTALGPNVTLSEPRQPSEQPVDFGAYLNLDSRGSSSHRSSHSPHHGTGSGKGEGVDHYSQPEPGQFLEDDFLRSPSAQTNSRSGSQHPQEGSRHDKGKRIDHSRETNAESSSHSGSPSSQQPEEAVRLSLRRGKGMPIPPGTPLVFAPAKSKGPPGSEPYMLQLCINEELERLEKPRNSSISMFPSHQILLSCTRQLGVKDNLALSPTPCK